jgi:hypothetical protein
LPVVFFRTTHQDWVARLRQDAASAVFIMLIADISSLTVSSYQSSLSATTTWRLRRPSLHPGFLLLLLGCMSTLYILGSPLYISVYIHVPVIILNCILIMMLPSTPKNSSWFTTIISS